MESLLYVAITCNRNLETALLAQVSTTDYYANSSIRRQIVFVTKLYIFRMLYLILTFRGKEHLTMLKKITTSLLNKNTVAW